MNPKELGVLTKLLPARGRVLEIGTFDGATAAHWAKAQPKVKFTSVDPFKKGPGTDAGSLEIWRANKQDNMDLFVGNSPQFAASNRKKFDVVFIDGAHSGLWCLTDLTVAGKVLKKRGKIWVHDFVPKLGGIIKAVKIFCLLEGYKITSRGCRTVVLEKK